MARPNRRRPDKAETLRFWTHTPTSADAFRACIEALYRDNEGFRDKVDAVYVQAFITGRLHAYVRPEHHDALTAWLTELWNAKRHHIPPPSTTPHHDALAQLEQRLATLERRLASVTTPNPPVHAAADD